VIINDDEAEGEGDYNTVAYNSTLSKSNGTGTLMGKERKGRKKGGEREEKGRRRKGGRKKEREKEKYKGRRILTMTKRRARETTTPWCTTARCQNQTAQVPLRERDKKGGERGRKGEGGRRKGERGGKKKEV
jgi:hypothetical protein